VGSSRALCAAEKAEAAGRPCMWTSVLDDLAADDALSPTLQVSQPGAAATRVSPSKVADSA